LSKRTVSGFIFAFVLVSSLSFALDDHLARSEPGTIIVPDDYEKIQWAVGNASDGDTVFVRAGTYNEYVLIDKSLTLEGENKSTIVIGNGTGTAFFVPPSESARHVAVTGFTIENYDTGIRSVGDGHGGSSSFAAIDNSFIRNCRGACVDHYGSGSVVDNLFFDNTNGIYVGLRTRSNITGNLISFSDGYAIALIHEPYGNATDNYIRGNRYGVFLSGEGGSNFLYTLCNNTLYENDYAVYVDVSEHPDIMWDLNFHHNNFVNNTLQAFFERDETSNISWDAGCPAGGNYWSDYNGSDSYGGQYQNITGSDGFGDIPYAIGLGQQDNYPFIEPLTLPAPPFPSPSNPAARFLYSPANPVVNETITFDASVSGDLDGSIINHQWDFGDGANSTGIDPIATHSYESVGSYGVVLKVTDNDGFNDTSTKTVTVEKIRSSISIMADPSPITIRENTTISGMISPVRPDVNVTTWYKPQEVSTWDILANITTDENSKYSYSWIPSETGNYTLKVSWPGDDYTFQNESIPIEFTCFNISSSISISTSCASTYVGFKVNVTGRLEDMYGNSLVDETVVLYYTFKGITTWTPITSDQTDGFGNYFAVWIPPATGDFIMKAEWTGNSTHSAINNTISLNSLPYNNQYVFSVESNSTVSSLAFDSADLKLEFEVTGPSGTEGYIRVTIAKTLVDNIEKLEVKLNDEEVEYMATQLDDSWLIFLTYSHSTHQISVDLNIDIITEFPSSTLTLVLMIATLLAVIVYSKKTDKSQKLQ
jgi:serine protease